MRTLVRSLNGSRGSACASVTAVVEAMGEAMAGWLAEDGRPDAVYLDLIRRARLADSLRLRKRVGRFPWPADRRPGGVDWPPPCRCPSGALVSSGSAGSGPTRAVPATVPTSRSGPALGAAGHRDRLGFRRGSQSYGRLAR